MGIEISLRIFDLFLARLLFVLICLTTEAYTMSLSDAKGPTAEPNSPFSQLSRPKPREPRYNYI